jgi:hypothetical protein
MLGGVFGKTNGIAPGYSGTLDWWKLRLYSEGEYVFDAEPTHCSSVPLHSPACLNDVPAFFRAQSFAYVELSHPQTGIVSAGHSDGFAVQ